MHRKSRNGFTLFELMVIFAVFLLMFLGIFMGIRTQLAKTRDARRILDFNLVQKSLQQYYDDKGCYPPVLPNCGQQLAYDNTEYFKTMPCDPKSRSAYTYVTNGSPLCSAWYKMYTNLEIKTSPLIDSAGCRTGCGPGCAYNFGIASENTYLERCLPTPTTEPTTTPAPSSTPVLITITVGPTTTPIPPTPTPVLYVCAPGGGSGGSCEAYAIPTMSLCPQIFYDDPSCQSKCGTPANRCKNSKGKYKPTGAY